MRAVALSAVILLSSLPSSLNPLFLNQEGYTAVVEMLYVSPLRLGSGGELRSYAARLVELKGRRAVLEVLPGFFWEGGRPLSASDLAFTYNFLAHYRRNPTYPYWRGISAFKRGRRVVVVFPAPPEKYHFLFPILPERLLRRARPEKLEEFPPSGPYRLKSRSPSRMVLEGREGFPLKVSFSRIVLREVPDPVTRKIMMEAGQGDICVCSRQQLPRKGVRIFKISRPAFLYLGFRGLTPEERCWVARRVKGLSLSSVAQGFAKPILTPFQLWFPAEEAKLLCGKGSPPTNLTLLIPAQRERLILAQIIQASLAPVKVKIISLERGLFLRRLRSGNFQLVLSAFSLDFPSDLKEILGCKGSANYFGYCSREMEGALQEGNWGKAREVFLRDLPFLPLYESLYPVAVKKGLGWRPFENSFSSASPFRSIVQ